MAASLYKLQLAICSEIRSLTCSVLAAEEQLQLTVSFGCARNKLLAKLSSQAAKPNGLHAVETPQVW